MTNKISKMLSMATVLAIGGFCPQIKAEESPLKNVGNYYGHVDFFTSGASFTDPGTLLNGAQCLLDEASLTIPPFSSDEHPKLVAAYLYWGGSLFSDDKDDLFVTSELACRDYINNVNNCRADKDEYRDMILQAAKDAADKSVDLFLPGQSTPQTITVTDQEITAYAYYKSDGAEKGNVAFFIARADITDLLKEKLTGFSGEYKVRGLTADICNGQEALCSRGETCKNMSDAHTNASASFSLVLVLEEPSWRLRRVALYQGLQGFNSSKSTITLNNIRVDDPPNGKLSYYIMEGDSSVSSLTDEWVSVNGGNGELKLIDSANPEGNPFNGTINTSGLSGVAGVDIDQFDISKSLSSSSESLDITFSTGSDFMALAAVNVSVAVFGPVLEYDSSLTQIDNLSESEALKPISYLATISNTGNLNGNAEFTLVMPKEITSWEIEQLPAGSVDNSLATGGNGRGVLNIKNIPVEVGKVALIRFNITPSCDARAKPLILSGEVSYDDTSFKITASEVTIINDEKGTCPSDVNPPEEPQEQQQFWQKYNLSLEGGGGCNNSGALSFWPLLLLLIPLAIRKKGHEKP